ncbi:Virginiamycin B lyase [Enhygromyxa salina]|uniref:Virginiamycin B lyase n=1 Tax=Enhygromyxa salina TaxID=215803 RepID=A0A2S9YL66_9BACT|nr:lyase [Enhygromyxa salina]PRQ05857.1 Virginiamycin B lyase [Enhygromyxa salina]
MDLDGRITLVVLGLSCVLVTACGEPELELPHAGGSQTAGALNTSGQGSSASASAGDGAETGGDESPNDDGGGDGDPCASGGSAVDFSYLWVANTDQGSVSKIDTQSVTELARYRTGPANVEHSPSRTTVSLDGRFALVGNRASGSVTLVAAHPGDCIDENVDDTITTSQGPDDLLDWGDDECVLWSTALPDVGPGIESGPRGMTFDPGDLDPNTCAYSNPKIWVGWHGSLANEVHMARLNPSDGAIEEVVDIQDWDRGWADYPPYGAAYDGHGGVWFTALRGDAFRLDTKELSVERWVVPEQTQAYGMTVDPEGKVWFAGCGGPVTVLEPETDTFTTIPGTEGCNRGVASDRLGNAWIAMNAPCGLAQVDRQTKQLIRIHTPPEFDDQCSTPVGVSIDAEGFVWMVDQDGWAWKIDPESYDKELLAIPGNHYTYSDMTGGGLNAVVFPQ